MSKAKQNTVTQTNNINEQGEFFFSSYQFFRNTGDSTTEQVRQASEAMYENALDIFDDRYDHNDEFLAELGTLNALIQVGTPSEAMYYLYDLEVLVADFGSTLTEMEAK